MADHLIDNIAHLLTLFLCLCIIFIPERKRYRCNGFVINFQLLQFLFVSFFYPDIAHLIQHKLHDVVELGLLLAREFVDFWQSQSLCLLDVRHLHQHIELEQFLD
jgi:hypothetical protein